MSFKIVSETLEQLKHLQMKDMKLKNSENKMPKSMN